MKDDKYIYIIDDNQEYSLYLNKLLNNYEYKVFLFKDPTELFYELENKKVKPDLIIIDLSMPEINGLDIIKYLNSSKELQKLKKIIVSAKAEFKSNAEFKDIQFFIKPIIENDFIAFIDRLLEIERTEIFNDENISKECQLFSFLENSSFYTKIIITKIFPRKIEFTSELEFQVGNELKFFSRSMSDLLGISCEFKSKVTSIKKINNFFWNLGELVLDNKIDYEKILTFIKTKNSVIK